MKISRKENEGAIMKWNHWTIVMVLLVLAGLGGMAGFNTTIGQQQQEIAEVQKETDRLEAWRYWIRLSLMPLPYHQPLDQLWVSSGTGYRMNPLGGMDAEEKLHKGIDYAAAVGTPVKAVLAGEVQEHWLPPGGPWKGHPVMGGMIVIDHGDGLLSISGHLSKTFVHEGEYVEAGQVIGEVGNTGMSTGSHLHFELVVDPLRYLEER